jgi:hypothetical protein
MVTSSDTYIHTPVDALSEYLKNNFKVCVQALINVRIYIYSRYYTYITR